jgi:polyisoprenoid-binding protein YceI
MWASAAHVSPLQARMRTSLLLLSLLATPSLAAGWALDLANTELVVKVWKTGAAAGLAHDHVIRATRVSGSARLDEAANPRFLNVSLSVEVAGLVPDEPDVRQRYGVAGAAVPDSDRQKVKEHMLSDEQLDATRYPTISFTSKQVSSSPDGALECLGDLTVHGVKKEVLFPVTMKVSEQKVEGDAHVKFRTSDFGIKPYSTALGLVGNKDEVELVVHVALKRE